MKLILMVFLVFVTAVGADAQKKPNVVIMLADNVGYGDIGAYGAGEVRGMPTTRIDSIAAQGLRLTQYLVEPGCTPSRAALMTGRYSVRSGLSAVIVGGTPNTLQANALTLGELFKSQGYATAMAGKWHLGSSEISWRPAAIPIGPSCTASARTAPARTSNRPARSARRASRRPGAGSRP